MTRRRLTYGILGVLALLSLLLFASLWSIRYNPWTTTYSATYLAKRLLGACEAFREHPASGGKYPASLSELHSPPFGGSSFLRDGQSDLLDPWGNPFRYVVVAGADGKQEVYIWAERTVDGKLTLAGAKRTTEGQVLLFR